MLERLQRSSHPPLLDISVASFYRFYIVVVVVVVVVWGVSGRGA